MSARLPTSTKENHDLWPSSLEYLRIAFLHLLNCILMICKHDRWHCAHRCILSLKLQYNLSIVESNQPIDEIPSLLDVSTTTKKTNPQNLENPGTLSLHLYLTSAASIFASQLFFFTREFLHIHPPSRRPTIQSTQPIVMDHKLQRRTFGSGKLEILTEIR